MLPMKILLPIVLCSMYFALTGADAAAADGRDALYDGYTGFAIPAEPVLPEREVHPSLWFRSADVPRLRALIREDAFAAERWAATLELADLEAALPAAPAANDEKRVIHQYYGSMSMAARAHALAGLLLEDPAAAAAHRQRAKALLMRAYDGPIFQLDSKVKGSPVDEIYRGTWLQNYAHAYDCLQAFLTPEEDRAIRDRLAKEAEVVYENLYPWTPRSPHNHLSKPAWGLGSIALALSDDPRARDWLARAIEAANKNTRYLFSGDGIYREGSHYLIFSLTNFVPFLYHYRNVSGVDGFAAFQPVFETMVAVRNSRGWLPNIEDSYIRPTPTHLVAEAYRASPTRLHSSASLAEVLMWAYETCDFGPFDEERERSGFNYTGASWDYPLEIDELLTWDPSIQPVAPDVAPDQFLEGGQSVFRDAWESAGPQQRYLLFHGVAVADNHNHHDQLSFILEAAGQMMCSDSGYSRGTYSGPERKAWYVTPAAHNTLTFDGEPASPRASNVTPASVRHAEPGLLLETKTTTELPKHGRWSRTVCRVADDYFVVVDRVEAEEPMAVQGSLHGGRGTLEPAGDGKAFVWKYAEDRYGSAARLRTWIVAPGADTVVRQGELTYIKGDYAEYPYLETSAASFGAPWITVLKPGPADDAMPFEVVDLSDGARTSVLIRAGGERVLVTAANGEAVNFHGHGIETDASLAIVRWGDDGRLLNRFRDGGTTLRAAEWTKLD